MDAKKKKKKRRRGSLMGQKRPSQEGKKGKKARIEEAVETWGGKKLAGKYQTCGGGEGSRIKGVWHPKINGNLST